VYVKRIYILLYITIVLFFSQPFGNASVCCAKADESYFPIGYGLSEKQIEMLNGLLRLDDSLGTDEEYKAAAYELTRMLSLRPDNAFMLMTRGLVSNRLQRYEQALTDFQRALVLIDSGATLPTSGVDSTTIENYCYYFGARVQYSLGQYAGAAAYYEILLSESKRGGGFSILNICYHTALCYYYLNDIQGAVQKFIDGLNDPEIFSSEDSNIWGMCDDTIQAIGYINNSQSIVDTYPKLSELNAQLRENAQNIEARIGRQELLYHVGAWQRAVQECHETLEQLRNQEPSLSGGAYSGEVKEGWYVAFFRTAYVSGLAQYRLGEEALAREQFALVLPYVDELPCWARFVVRTTAAIQQYRQGDVMQARASLDTLLKEGVIYEQTEIKKLSPLIESMFQHWGSETIDQDFQQVYDEISDCFTWPVTGIPDK
jgi:tetratricopeptide (TPR) repeat protein